MLGYISFDSSECLHLTVLHNKKTGMKLMVGRSMLGREGGNNDNIESILPLPIQPFSPKPMSVKNSAHLLAPFKLDVSQKNSKSETLIQSKFFSGL